MAGKYNVAVVFGGASQEHDVSVVSAQQLMDAADATRINVIPVYVDFENKFFSGPHLRNIQRFRPRPTGLRPVRFEWGDAGPVMLGAGEAQPIDAVLPVLHGPFGEDGRIQAYFELLGFPVTGFSASASALAMRKDATKSLVKGAGVNVLEHVVVNAAQARDAAQVVAEVTQKIGFPAIVKPANLGSSIGVGLARDAEMLMPLVQAVLREDNLAIIEPQVRNLEEFNIAMMWRGGAIHLSAIERPKSSAELLDFKEKYLSSSAPKGAFLPSEGMLSLTRDINPDLPPEHLAKIHDFARRAFTILGLRGAPRIDFMMDNESGEIWFNEINPIPGSYGFFLWEAAAEPLLYPELITHLVEEALRDTVKDFHDPVPEGAYLLPR